MSLKSFYHAVVPPSIRNPIGLKRRQVLNVLRGRVSDRAMPVIAVPLNLQAGSEYGGGGRRASQAIVQLLATLGISTGDERKLIDVSCGPALIVSHLKESRWRVAACDSDPALIESCRSSIGGIEFHLAGRDALGQFAKEGFDIVLAIALFSRISVEEQRLWRDQLARLSAPGSLLVISTLSPHSVRVETEESLTTVDSAAPVSLHTVQSIVELFPPWQLLRYVERGLDGYHDVSVLRRS